MPNLGIQVRFVSLVARIGRHPILLRHEGMNHPCLESRAGEGPLGRQVVVSRSFHDDDGVLNVILLLSFANLFDRQLKESCLMLHGLGFDEQIPKVVSHHPLRAMFGRIDTDDGKPLTPYLLDAAANHAIGFV